MTSETHDKILFWMKAAMFTAFAVNIIRVAVKTWKYGGSKSKTAVSYENQNDSENPIVDDEE